MAHIIQDDQGSGSSGDGHLTVIQADGQTHIQLPDADFMAKGEILRDGQDLILQSSDGTEVVVENYFSAMPAPVLTTPHGSMLTPELVESFVKTHGDVEYAANTTASDVSAVGLIKEVSGDATITRADGSSEKIVQGMEVHQGDIVETADKGAVNIVFIDESSFSISNNARLAIDEYVFDPSTQAGETNVSILRGMFVFTSGLIGRDDPDDVKIETPVGSIGIRGTTIAGDIQPDGESKITVVEGAIVIANGTGEVTLSDQYQTVTLTGFESQIQMAGTLDAGQMKDSYGMLGTVNAGFFNTLNEDAPAPDDQPAPPQGTDAPADAPADANESKAEAQQPVLADANGDAQNANFDTAVVTKDSLKTTVDTKADTISETVKVATATHSDKFSALLAQVKATYLAAQMPLDVQISAVEVDDDAGKGDEVGRVYLSYDNKGAVISFSNVPKNAAGEPLFELKHVDGGKPVYQILLTQAGADVVDDYRGSSLGPVTVRVTLPDGRIDTASTRVLYGDFNNNPSHHTLSDLHLNTLIDSPTANLKHGSYYENTGVGGLGESAAYLGDYDRDGDIDFAITTGSGEDDYVIFSDVPTRIVPSGSDANGMDSSGMSIAGGRDFDAGGVADFVVGNPYLSTGGLINNGQVIIYSGNSTSSILVSGSGDSDLFGSSVAMVDFNGDGRSDVFVGAEGYNGGIGKILGYVGDYTAGATVFPNAVNLLSYGYGDTTHQSLGFTMTSLRDYNNDGYGDLAVGSIDSAGMGNVRIYQGSSNASPYMTAYSEIANIKIDGHEMPLFDLGDVDGDGRSDLFIAETGYNAGTSTGENLIEGAGHIYLGNSDHIIINTSDTNNGFIGAGAAGDFNGDGYSDIFMATRNGDMVDAYVIYGGTGLGDIANLPTWMAANPNKGFHMTLNLTDLLDNPNSDEISMIGTSIGDKNGDGFDDLLITTTEINGGAGGYFVVNGHASVADTAAGHVFVATAANPNVTADSANDALVGTSGNNILSDGNYQDVSFNAGFGNDQIIMSSGSANSIDGGFGFDTVHMSAPSIDFTNISELSGIEKFMFEGAGAQTVTIGLNDIFGLLQSSHDHFNAGLSIDQGSRYTVRFGTTDGMGVDNLTIDTSATTSSTPGAGDVGSALGMPFAGQTTDGDYNVYTFGNGYQLMIDANITVTIQ